MSIYATLWTLRFPSEGDEFIGCDWVAVTAQGVPPHIGTPTAGVGGEEDDPYREFLPPAVPVDPDGTASVLRAVVFVTEGTSKGTARHAQEYAAPLLVLSGSEYAAMPFAALHERLVAALRGVPPADPAVALDPPPADSPRSVALGEVRGALLVLARLLDRADHAHTFELDRLPDADDAAAAVAAAIDGAQRVEVARLPDWRATVGGALRRWCFEPPGHRAAAPTDAETRDDVVAAILDRIAGALSPSAAFAVGVTTSGFYECAWDDFVFEGVGGRHLLHLAVSD